MRIQGILCISTENYRWVSNTLIQTPVYNSSRSYEVIKLFQIEAYSPSLSEAVPFDVEHLTHHTSNSRCSATE